MSKLLDATIRCPQCGQSYPVKLLRTIWGEHESLREKVMNDEVNICTCPHCSYSFKAPFPFMYVDVVAGFAVWWEPEYDQGIDSDQASYAKMFGPNSYYAAAPRIADWDEFIETIKMYYRGELKGGKIEKFDASALKQSLNQSNKKNKTSGCLGIVLLIILLTGSLTIGLTI